MIEKVELRDKLKLSRIVHGHWRLKDWNLSPQALLSRIEEVAELGITSIDHADIYGDYECETLFGNALALKPALRNQLQIITKSGIQLMSNKYPERKIKSYNYSSAYLINSAEQSLSNLKCGYIDLFLLHRPAPFFNPEEVAEAFYKLKKSGKVLHFGVSNFSQQQFEMLSSYLDFELSTNQVEISPYTLTQFENGNIDFFLKERIKPMAWSPLAGGSIFNPYDAKGERILNTLNRIAGELQIDNVSKLVFSWLLNHPSGIIPVVGSGKIERIKAVVEAQNITLSLEHWYQIYCASTGEELP